MKSKKKNEMEKAQNTMDAAQELDMDELEDVAGGKVVERIEEDIYDIDKRKDDFGYKANTYKANVCSEYSK